MMAMTVEDSTICLLLKPETTPMNAAFTYQEAGKINRCMPMVEHQEEKNSPHCEIKLNIGVKQLANKLREPHPVSARSPWAIFRSTERSDGRALPPSCGEGAAECETSQPQHDDFGIDAASSQLQSKIARE